ncbi:hypothetical protein T492DRAFT_1085235 [Pavlovales sp. CCMP2436]|nr:hypothetical protein T492DRAFT_1085235 [Pavlovales sp. CCMP2436]
MAGNSGRAAAKLASAAATGGQVGTGRRARAAAPGAQDVQSSATPVDAQSSAEPVTKKTRDSLNAQKRRSEQNAADAKHAELIPLGKGRASRIAAGAGAAAAGLLAMSKPGAIVSGVRRRLGPEDEEEEEEAVLAPARDPKRQKGSKQLADIDLPRASAQIFFGVTKDGKLDCNVGMEIVRLEPSSRCWGRQFGCG